MVNSISIKNYKSIKQIDFNTKKINVFIGEHNSGKSNILEALSWFSVNALDKNIFSQLFRYKTFSNFFYDFDGTQIIEVTTDTLALKIRYGRNNLGALMNYFEGIIYNPEEKALVESEWQIHNPPPNTVYFHLNILSNEIDAGFGNLNSDFRTYYFKRLQKFEINFRPFLNPPFGENIPSILQSNKEWKQLVSDFFKSKKFRLIVKPVENEIEMVKEVNDELYGFPYQVISETMQRFVFLLLALESNSNSTIILDEPESNMFPFFVKDFAERIANDETNQYFIATHNPYLLGSLLEKTPLENISLFITRMEEYQTVIELCDNEQINELISLGSGAFFNLDSILK
jgi:AAA15 family ATPase/GTPase